MDGDASDDAASNRRRDAFLHWVSWAVLSALILFAFANVHGGDFLRPIRSGLLLVLIVLVALWFIACFTGDPDRNLRHGFVFAYAFTFGSFALLITPFVSTENGPSLTGSDEVREAHGKASANSGTAQSPTSASAPKAAAAAASAAGGSNSTADRALRPPEGAIQLVRGCVVTDANGTDAVSAVTRCPAWANPLPALDATRSMNAASVPASAASAGVASAREVGRQFAWLVSIGGVTVRKFEPVLPEQDTQPDAFVQVYGGIAVPLFVVVLAFIGGAVSLSRRIPEYQRRSEPGYIATSAEPAMQPFQVRESVVFQIMQLVSAPFLAMATWYIVSPTTIAGAAGLAFGTGFASEPLLLMIRGMVEGIRPASTSRPASAGGVVLKGSVVDPDKQPVNGVTVLLRSVHGNDNREATTDSLGQFEFAGVAPGEVVLTASAPPGSAELRLVVTELSPPPVQLRLA